MSKRAERKRPEKTTGKLLEHSATVSPKIPGPLPPFRLQTDLGQLPRLERNCWLIIDKLDQIIIVKKLHICFQGVFLGTLRSQPSPCSVPVPFTRSQCVFSEKANASLLHLYCGLDNHGAAVARNHGNDFHLASFLPLFLASSIT